MSIETVLNKVKISAPHHSDESIIKYIAKIQGKFERIAKSAHNDEIRALKRLLGGDPTNEIWDFKNRKEEIINSLIAMLIDLYDYKPYSGDNNG